MTALRAPQVRGLTVALPSLIGAKFHRVTSIHAVCLGVAYCIVKIV